MTDSAPAIFVAIEASSFGAAIRQSTWIYMTANLGHIVALVCFAGAVTVMDLRMAGVFAATAPGRVLRGARTVAILAFLGMALSGSIMFIADASHIIVNPVFQAKLGLIALGLVNVAVFERALAPKVRELPPLAPLPGTVRAAGLASIAIWLLVAICGRAIAYY